MSNECPECRDPHLRTAVTRRDVLVRAAHGLKRLEQRIMCRAGSVKQSAAFRPFDVCKSKQQMLGGDELVAE